MLDSLDSTRAVILKGSVYTASVTFEGDGAAVDPGVVTVAVTREDGSVLVSGTASGTGAAARTFGLDTTSTALLDVLNLAWTSATLGVLTTQVEIVGGFVCGIGQLNDPLGKAGSSPASYSQDAKERARTIATDAFERECGVAFTPRYARLIFDPTFGLELVLPTPQVRAVRSVKYGGVVQPIGDVVVNPRAGSLFRLSAWVGVGLPQSIEIVWEHGWRSPPADVARAITLIASGILKDGPFDDRGYGVTDDAGFVRLLTAGIGGAAFSIPEVQAALRRHRYPGFS